MRSSLLKKLCRQTAASTCALAAMWLPSLVNAQVVQAGNIEAVQQGPEMARLMRLDRVERLYSDGTSHATPMVRRAPPPVPGGGCQANGDFVNAAEAVTSIATIQTATNGRQADNFRTTSAPSPIVSQLSWSAAGRIGTTTFVDSPAFTSFAITIFNDNGGFPGTAVALTQIVGGANITSTVSGTLAGFTLRDYVATLPGPITLQPNTCYWVEIRPSSFTTNQQYLHRTSNQGDGVIWARTNTGTYAVDGVDSLDLNFCFNIPITSVADGVTCPVASGMSCYTSPSFNTCQVWDGTGVGQSAHLAGGADFRLADNFSISSAQSLTGFCFAGFYGGTATIPSAEIFRVRIYPDGSPTGVPNENAPVLDITVNTATPGVGGGTITRGIPVIPGFTRGFNYSVTLSSALNLPSGCYWLEIQSQDPVVPWFWLNKANARATTISDAYRHQRNAALVPTYSLNTQIFNGDQSWCLQGVSLVRSTSCLSVPALPNSSCATATTLTLGAAPTFGHNLIPVPPTAAIPFACLSNVPNENGLWYRVVGNGQDITISTCNTGSNPFAAATDFDTVISVYCTRGTAPNECDGPFVCIGTNDDAANCTAADGASSTITFPTVSGQVYYAYVYGFEAGNGVIDTGFFYVNATASGTPSNPAAIACTNLTNCQIDIPSGAVFETDACIDASTNSNCTTANPLALNTVGTGRVSNDGATRDFDFWRLPDVNDPSGGQWFTIDFRTEFPGFIQIGRGFCSGDAVPLVQLGFTACSSANDFNIFVPNGEFYVNLSVNSFNGLPCFVGDTGNRYWVKVTPVSAVGACCITGTACLVTVRSNGVGGDATQDCITQGGVYLGDGTTCDPGTNAPCDPAGGAPAGATVGSCCLGFGECALTVSTTCTGGLFTANGVCDPNTCAAPIATCCFPSGTCLITADAAACTTAGGSAQATLRACTPNACPAAPTGGCCSATFTCSTTTQAACVGTWLGANVTCTPTNCTPPPAGVCCRGATCNTAVNQASCTGSGNAGAFFATGAATCNAIGDAATPCCYANYNKTNGIEVQDIFDFLNDWFAGNNFAATGGDGTAAPNVQSIFDFLNAWFAGGCS